MEAVNGINAISKVSPEERKFILHEIKYALLGAALMSIFLLPWSSSLIKSVFPAARGPMVLFYKLLLFVAIYYIIQKSTWFQHH